MVSLGKKLILRCGLSSKSLPVSVGMLDAPALFAPSKSFPIIYVILSGDILVIKFLRGLIMNLFLKGAKVSHKNE